MSQQLVVQPDSAAGADAHIIDNTHAASNFGTLTAAIVGRSAAAKGALHYRFLIRFDLAAIPPSANINNATLRLFGNSLIGATAAQFTAYRLTRGDWTELGATWNKYDGLHDWTTPGGDYDTASAATGSAAGVQDVEFTTLAALVTDALLLRGGKLELLIVGPESELDSLLVTPTSEYTADPLLRPRLTINFDYLPQLAVTDHGDNTGATAAVSGADPAATNAVLLQTFDGQLGSGNWTAAGSIAGNGELPLELAAGHYFAYVHSTAGAVQDASPVVYFAVTDGLESIHSRCLAAVQARVRLLALEGLANDRVVIAKVPAGRNLASGVGLPAVVLSPHRAAMPAVAGTNSSDDVHYDVLVAIFDRDNQEPSLVANLDRHLLWRQQIARAFRNQRLAGVPEVINSEVEPAEGLLEEAWKRELMTSAVLLRFTSREARGF